MIELIAYGSAVVVLWVCAGAFGVGRRKRLNPPPADEWKRTDYNVTSFFLFLLGPLYVISQTFHEMGKGIAREAIERHEGGEHG